MLVGVLRAPAAPLGTTVLLAARTDRPAPVAESRTLASVDAVVPAMDSGPTDRVKVLYQVKRGDTLASIARLLLYVVAVLVVMGLSLLIELVN